MPYWPFGVEAAAPRWFSPGPWPDALAVGGASSLVLVPGYSSSSMLYKIGCKVLLGMVARLTVMVKSDERLIYRLPPKRNADH
jgi:hypothetical protein